MMSSDDNLPASTMSCNDEADVNTSQASMEDILDQSDLSDKEDAENLDLSPFSVNWLDLDFAGYRQNLGICSLPGCRFQKVWRSLLFDIQCLKNMGVDDAFCFCTKGEMYLYRTQGLLDKYQEMGITVHHYPIEDSHAPAIDVMVKIIEEVKVCLSSEKKTILHCFGGFGRSGLVAACLMMVLDENLSPEEACQKVRKARGDRAINSVKQYNFVNDFQEILKNYNQESKEQNGRSLSR